MAKPTSLITLGIDVSKDELVIHVFDTEQSTSIPNQPATVRDWLSQFPDAEIAIEPTSSYHLVTIEAALEQGFTVYLISPRQLVHYREAVNQRNKTDLSDAFLLARYLDRERDQLKPFQPQHAKAQALWTLLKRRGLLAQTRVQLRQSFNGIRLATKPLFNQISALMKRIDEKIRQLIDQLGWRADYQRCLTIPGIGQLNAAALVAAFHRGAFSGANAFVSFIGLDVTIRESGRFKGKRKLSKRGEAELRRLLYCAAHPARCHPEFDSFYLRQLDKGLPKTAANVILARKLARIAFALMRNQQAFNAG